MDDARGWVPEAPHPQVALTVWTAQGVATAALLVALTGGHWGDDLDCPLHDALHLGEGVLHQGLDFRKRLGGLHPVIPETCEAFGKHMLHLCGEHNYVVRMTQVAILS